MDEHLTEIHLRKALAAGLELDLSDPNLAETPHRIAKMWVREFFKTLDSKEEGFSNLTSFPNDRAYNQIIMLDRIHFTSMCSHHFLPFSGLAWLAYIPNKKLVGASKPSRLIDFFSRKPQLQETLGYEIIDEFNKKAEPKGCMVVIRGVHGCMSSRGVLQYSGAGMMTSAVSGVFDTDAKARSEGMDLIKISLMVHDI